jgi:hypothetical protein
LPSAVSWGALGAGVAFCLLLVLGLALAALALRPREATSLESVSLEPTLPAELLPLLSSPPAEPPSAPARPGPTPFAVGMSKGRPLLAREKPAEPAPPVVKPAAAPGEGGQCETYGTSVHFVSTPREAAQRAAQEQKLVFTLHVSGNFEDPAFT